MTANTTSGATPTTSATSISQVMALLGQAEESRNAGLNLPQSDIAFLDDVVTELRKTHPKLTRSKLARAVIRMFRAQWESTPTAERRRLHIEI